MNTSYRLPVFVAVCCILLAGCATYKPSNSVRTVAFSPKLKNEAVLEAVIGAARESKMPAMSKMDKANGLVEFGAFGMPQMGLTGQARITGDHQVEVMVKRGSVFVPLKAESEADLFTTNLAVRLAELEKKVQ